MLHMSLRNANRFLKASVGIAVFAILTMPTYAVVIFSDDFESYSPDANIFGGSSQWRSVDTDNGIVKARTDSGLIFNANNQYLEYYDNNRNAADTVTVSDNPDVATDVTSFTDAIVIMSFDFYEPTGSTASTNKSRFAVGFDADNNGKLAGSERSIELQLGNGDVYQALGVDNGMGGLADFIAIDAYTTNESHHIDVVGNFSNLARSYSTNTGGTVGPGNIDIWIDGTQIGDEVFFRNPVYTVDTLQMLASNSNISQVYYDNVVFNASIPTLTVDRSTGNLTFTNTSGLDIDDIVGYSITSDSNTLNMADAAWSSISDTNSNWVELSGDSGSDLSELEVGPIFGGLSVLADGTIDFGNVWFKHFDEDIVMQLLIDDAGQSKIVDVFVQYVPGSANLDSFIAGDLNFDGVVNLDDIEVFANNFHTLLTDTSSAATYALGDMNGDLISTYADLSLFREAYDAVAGNGAFAEAFGSSAVPEPSSLLILLGLAGGLAITSRSGSRLRTCPRALGLLAASVCFGLMSSAQATVVFEENFNAVTSGSEIDTANSAFTTGTANLASPNFATSTADTGNIFGEGTSNNYLNFVDGNTSNKPRITGPADLTSATAFQFSFDFYDPTSASDDLRIGLGNSSHNTSSRSVEFQFNSGIYYYRGTSGSIEVAYNEEQKYNIIALGNYGISPVNYDGGSEWIMPGTFDVWMNGVRVSNDVPMGNNGPMTTHISLSGGSDATTGDVYFDNIAVEDTISAFSFEGNAVLTLEVNETTGQTFIKNENGFAIDLDYYELSGPAGSFDTNGWSSLDSLEGSDPFGDGWDEAGGSGSELLSEFRIDGATSIASGNGLNLGLAYDETSSNTEGLIFKYALENGELITGLVSVVTGATNDADFDNDGDVDGSDFLAWQTGFGIPSGATQAEGDANADGAVNAADFTIWSSQYGNTSGGGSLAGATVPEPSTFVLLALLALATAAWQKR